jgi:hypothetical protein
VLFSNFAEVKVYILLSLVQFIELFFSADYLKDMFSFIKLTSDFITIELFEMRSAVQFNWVYVKCRVADGCVNFSQIFITILTRF